MHLALFPLNLVVFPGEYLNLHIFEPKYRQLIIEAHDKGMHFGIPTVKQSSIGQNTNKLSYGTEVKLISLAKTYADGKMDIKTKGLRAFSVDEFIPKLDNRLYPAGDVTFLHNELDGDLVTSNRILELTAKLYRIMKIEKKLPEPVLEFSVFDIAHKIGLSQNQELHLLSFTKESERQEFVLDHLTSLIPIVTEMESMRKKIQMNGHFKNEIPPVI